MSRGVHIQRFTRALLTGALLLFTAGVWAQSAGHELLKKKLEGSYVEEHLGERIDLSRTFTNHRGERVTLGEYFGDDKPVLLTLNYYECTMLCSLQLNGLLDALKELSWTAGDQFRVVTISIDPREDWELARDKRASYIEELGRGDVDWNFLVGDDAAIQGIADEVGFGFSYDEAQDQFAHTAVIFFLSPDGKIVRYLYGIEYRDFDLKAAFHEASDGTVGTPFERVLLSCFHYDATEGKYGPWAFGIMRLGGALVVVLLGGFLALMWWREMYRRRVQNVG